MSGETRLSVSLPATLPERVHHFAEQRGDQVALREKRLGVWREVNWREYRAGIAAAARALWGVGVRPGDAVAIISDNRTEWLYADLGAQAIGAMGVGVYQTNPPDDVAYIVNDCRAKVLFCEDQEQVDKAVAIAGDTPSIERVVVFDPRGTRGIDDARLVSWDDFLASGRAQSGEGTGDPGGDHDDRAWLTWFVSRLSERDPSEPSMVVYTSGTTGNPKGAALSSRNVLESASEFARRMGMSDRDTILSYLPLCHVAEKIFTVFLPLTSGCVVHFGESIETVQVDLREVSPTVFLGVPRIWEKMNSAVTVRMKDSSPIKRKLFDWAVGVGRPIAKRRLEGRETAADRLTWFVADKLVFRPLQERLGLRNCWLPVSGAAPISADLLLWYHSVGVPISEGYGQTECAGVSHLNWPGKVKLGTVGTPAPLVECELGDDGEVLLRGPNVFCGYLNQPEATAQTVDSEGWLHTGDIGTIDDAGYLSITGRKKEIIITSGGKNLSPEKIENALKTSPYIKEAVAIGDQRKFIGALVQIEFDTVGDWATRQKIAYTSFADLAGRPEVEKLIDGELRTANDLLARVEQVRAFRLLPKELHQDDGELTATQKVRRRQVMEKFAGLIESMYGGGTKAP